MCSLRFLVRATLAVAAALVASAGLPAKLPAAPAGDPCTLLPANRADPAQLVQLGLHDDDLVAMHQVNAVFNPIGPAPCVATGGLWFADVSDEEDATASSLNESLFSYATDADAHSAFSADLQSQIARFQAPSAQTIVQPLSLPTVGDESFGAMLVTGFSSDFPTGLGIYYAIVFRRGSVVTLLSLGGFGGLPPNADVLVALAQIVDGRIAMSLPRRALPVQSSTGPA